MVVSPEEANTFTPEENAAFTELETLVDAEIRNAARRETTHELAIELPKGNQYTGRVFSKLSDIYRNAGWTKTRADYHSNPPYLFLQK